MPSLHETYATLLRRGMPEHPTVHFDPDDGVPYLHGNWGRAIEDDARDLIEAHALRWWYTTEHLPWCGEVIKRGYIMADEDCVSMIRAGGGTVGSGPTTLDAIVVATKRLEPKE